MVAAPPGSFGANDAQVRVVYRYLAELPEQRWAELVTASLMADADPARASNEMRQSVVAVRNAVALAADANRRIMEAVRREGHLPDMTRIAEATARTNLELAAYVIDRLGPGSLAMSLAASLDPALSRVARIVGDLVHPFVVRPYSALDGVLVVRSLWLPYEVICDWLEEVRLKLPPRTGWDSNYRGGGCVLPMLVALFTGVWCSAVALGL